MSAEEFDEMDENLPLFSVVVGELRQAVQSRPGQSLGELMSAAQNDLRRIAHNQRYLVRAGDTLSTTALINEAWLKLQGSNLPDLNDRSLFLGIAARAMRMILVDAARAKLTEKRGGNVDVNSLDTTGDPASDHAEAERVLEIHDLLKRLEKSRPRLAQVVLLRHYGRLTEQEIGDVLDVNESTVRRDWTLARGWMRAKLKEG